MAKTTSIQILFTKRNAPKNGPTSSAKMNDMIEEIAHDLASFSDQWNNSIVPLFNTLPDGSIDIDAFVDGLSGNTLYTYDQASSTFNTGYYNTVKSRPYTVYEQFVNIYANIDSIKEELEEKISQSTPIAEQIALTDAAGFFTSLNVEDALAELKSEITIFDGSQFVLLDGKSGGQIINGGTAASNNLTLVSTSHSTKGKIIFGTSSYDEVNNRLGIGITAPLSKLGIFGNTSIGTGYAGITAAPTNGLIIEGQVGIGIATPATSAVLDITSTTGALLIPRMSTTQRDALTAVNGMLIYNTTTDKVQARAAAAWVDLH